MSDLLQHAKTLDDAGRKDALIGILDSIENLQGEETFAIAQLLGHKQVLLDMIAKEAISKPIVSPENDLKSFFELHGDDIEQLSSAERQLLTHIVQSMIELEGSDAINVVFNRVKTDSDRVAILSHFLMESSDVHVASTVAESAYEMDRHIVAEALAQWAKTDPDSAWNFTSAVGSKNARTRLQRSVLYSWSQSNPLNLLANLEKIPDQLLASSHSEAIHVLAQKDPARAMEELKNFPEGFEKQNVASIIATNWSRMDPQAALDWLHNNAEGHALTNYFLQGIVVSNPKMAWDIALGLPLDENGVGFEAEVIGYHARQDAENAIEMLHLARNQKTLRSFYWSIGPELIRQGKSPLALGLVQDESEELQTSYFQWIAFAWLESDPQEVYAVLEDLPTVSIRESYSRLMLDWHEQQLFLEKEQLVKLEHMLDQVKDEMPAHTH